ncbi:MAG TPA: hypothetical protein VIG28_02835 [Leifsonia sp.]|jgi:lysylphosphatidylglycerol synthetase-like protein (DUF2156 family)
MAVTRPGSVTVVGVLAYIEGVLGVIGGVLILFTRNSMAGATNSATLAGITTSAIVSIIVGGVILVVARGLLDGSRVARIIVTIAMIFNALNGLLSLFTLQFFSGIIELLWAIVLLSLLYTSRANTFFGGRAAV